jgi:phosphoribosylformylglycinamidine synthase
MIWRVEIKEKPGVFDSLGAGVCQDILDLGVAQVKAVRTAQIFLLEGEIDKAGAQRICRELLVDEVVQEYVLQDRPVKASRASSAAVIEVAYNAGVMDPVEASVLKGIRDLGIAGVSGVRTARKYTIEGKLSARDVVQIKDKVLMNRIVQHAVSDPADDFKSRAGAARPLAVSAETAAKIRILGLKDKALLELSKKGQLYLNLDEMKAIRKHFTALRRDPTDVELETIAQTWSEHCHHKTFRGNIDYTVIEGGRSTTQRINNLLKETIVKVTTTLNKPWCVSVFHDNAGVIKFDDQFNVCFKVETHNHPSALEPFGGANTGVGGVIRDILGTGLGARPVCNTDVFCFARPDYPFDALPSGALHPRRVMKGVVSGVRDYGNKMGIPTVNGAICFDDRYVGNPLVFCGTVGLIPKKMEHKKVLKGDLIVVCGGRTGRDGIHGATFSSGDLTHESEVVSSGAVQIGNPIEEKKVQDVLLKARDEGLYTALTDCGAGGLSSAVGEMGSELGARVDLEKVPLKYQGLNYAEIWISESQERMVMSVPAKNIERFKQIFAAENVDMAVIGDFPGTGRLELFYNGVRMADLDMDFMHHGIPRVTKKAVWAAPKTREPKFAVPADLTPDLMRVLSDFNVCSKESIIRRYDHEVQGGSVVKPLAGPACDGPSDASVLRPRLGVDRGIAVSNGINPRFGELDPYWMAASAVDEAIRQIISVGGNLSKIALLDNFCWGNPDKPDRLGGLVRAAKGCHDFALAFGTPFISGKDSFYNEYNDKGKSIAIPGTILISAIGIVDDVTKSVTMDLKKAGNLLYAAGTTYDEWGGSVYLASRGVSGGQVPVVRAREAVRVFESLSKAVARGLAVSIHDCSEGGLAAAVAEMAFAGGLGAAFLARSVPYEGHANRDDMVLFSESNSRFVIEVPPENKVAFERTMKDVPCRLVGQVLADEAVFYYGLKDNLCLKADIHALKAAWKKPLA